MYSHFNNQFQQTVLTLHPGEYYASGEDIVIATVLGSCIAVAIYDERLRIGGLNHFMLPASYLNPENMYASETGKYGLYAMEFLINSLFKLGSQRHSMKAKVFGGASVLASTGKGLSNVSRNNIDFAFEYLKTEGIPVTSRDVGGTVARKIFFYPTTARVLLKRLSGKLITAVTREEEKYLHTLETKKEGAGGDLTLF